MRLIACGLALLAVASAHAQGGVPLVTVATDQSSLSVPTTFGVPAATTINEAGDFAFIGNGDSGLFFRAAGATSATLLLQHGDAVPGFPGSLIVAFRSGLALNSTKSIIFGVIYNLPDGLNHAAVLTYDGSTYRKVASSEDIAPGSGGAVYGTGLTPGSINDNGDVDFSAVPVGKSAPTFYILPSGSLTAVRVAALDDTPPAACTWCSETPIFAGGIVSNSTSLVLGTDPAPPLNSSGQMLLSLDGGAFIGTKDGLQLVTLPASGPCRPSAVFDTQIAPLLNDAGNVAFTDSGSAICLSTSAATPAAPVVSLSDPPPAAIGGTYASLFALALDDAGDILFRAQISAGKTGYALLRYRQTGAGTGQIDVVAYNGEVIPAPDGSTFASPSVTVPSTPPSTFPLSAFSAVSMANDGRVNFRVLLSQGSIAIYQQTGAAIPLRFAIEGGSAPSSSGGTFAFNDLAPLKCLNNGSTFFASYLLSGAAYFGEFLGTPGSIQSLLSTADALPAASRLSLDATPPRAAGHFVGFAAQQSGGRLSLFLSDTSTGTTSKVVSEGDSAPGSGNIIAPISNFDFFLNANGQLAFDTPFAGGSFPQGIFLWSKSSGLTKVAAEGDPSPVAGATFLALSLSGSFRLFQGAPEFIYSKSGSSFGFGSSEFITNNPGLPSSFNDAGQLAFSSEIRSATTAQSAIFLFNPSGTIAKVAAAGDPSPDGNTFLSFTGNALNSVGQVAFQGITGASFSQPGLIRSGLFVGSAGAPPRMVGTTGNNSYIFSGISDSGVLAFEFFDFFLPQPEFSVLTDVPGVAAQTVAADGGSAPGGGTISLGASYTSGTTVTTIYDNITEINGESDISFRAGITGGTADSGYFRILQSGPAAGTLQPVVLQGQPVSGGILGAIPIPNTQGANFALGPDGSLAFVNGFTNASTASQGMFVAQPNGSIFKVLAAGDAAPSGGTVNGLFMSQGRAAGGAGKFAFWAGLQGGTARQAIFVTAIPSGTASTTTKVALSPIPAVAGQQTTLTATVASAANGTPTGNVSFFDNGVMLGSGAVNSTGATFNTSPLFGGPHAITAQYSGDTNFVWSNSASVTDDVIGFAPPPANLTVTAGQSLPIPLTLYGPPTGNATFANLTFALTCSGLPANSSCSFTPSMVTPGAPPEGTVVQLTFSTMAASTLLPPELPRDPRPLGVIVLTLILSALMMTGMLKYRHSPRPRLACGMCLMVFGLACVMVGCSTSNYTSNSGSPGTPKGAATITMTATSSIATVSTVVNVTVQ
jgi:hypothetical protein